MNTPTQTALFDHRIIRYEVALGVVGAVIAKKYATGIGDALVANPPDEDAVRYLQQVQQGICARRARRLIPWTSMASKR